MTTNTFGQSPVIIVGGGLAGLSAAALLARAGQAVTLFEEASTLGGRARTKQNGDFFFNQGAHAIYLGGPGERLLNELGVYYSGSSPARGKYLALDGGKLHAFPASMISLLRTTLLGSEARVELARFFSTVKHMKLADLHSVSLLDWLEQHVHHPQVRRLLLAGARVATYTNPPDLLPVSLLSSLVDGNVRYLDSGWQTLVNGLLRVAQGAGAKIVTRARVAAIEISEEGHAVRLADGSLYPASAILLAVDPENASTLVADGTHEELHKWAAQAIPARVACFDVALRRLPRPQSPGVFGIDRPLYLSVHSVVARLAPQGGALIHTMKYLRPDEPDEPATTRQELEALLDVVQPGWRAEVETHYFLPHMIASNAMVQARQGGLPGRPGPAVPGIRNLYVAGDWVGAEGQLADACFASARNAASMVMAVLATQRNDYVVAG